MAVAGAAGQATGFPDDGHHVNVRAGLSLPQAADHYHLLGISGQKPSAPEIDEPVTTVATREMSRALGAHKVCGRCPLLRLRQVRSNLPGTWWPVPDGRPHLRRRPLIFHSRQQRCGDI